MPRDTITVIGTLPPIKGISPYCSELALELAETQKVEFINFRSIYPEWLYPGGTRSDDLYPVNLQHPYLEVRNLISWYNPLSWIWCGLSLKGSRVLAQWWSYPLAPIYMVILGIARLRGKRVDLTVHNVYPHERGRIKEFLNRIVFPLADTLIVHTEENRKELIDMGWKAEKIMVRPHPRLKMSGKGVQAIADKESARREMGLSEENKVLCFFGNIREYKGLDNLLLALAWIREVFPEIRLIIAGQPWGSWNKYEEIIRAERLEPYVIRKTKFLPFTELAKCLVASDLVVFPYKEMHSASGSLSLALEMGCRILCTREVGTEESDKIFLIEDSSEQSLVEGICEFFFRCQMEFEELEESADLQKISKF